MTSPRKSGIDPIVWIDCEMTGLDAARDALIEVAVIVTDSDLVPLGEGIDLVITPPPGALESMGDVVRDMHTSSGLLTELADGISMARAREQVLEYVKQYVPEPRKAPLAGNSIGTDKVFLEREMPELIAHLHYRVIDVSSIKELARRWYPRVYFASPPKAGGHRALADIAESIDELRYYRAALFPQGEGPGSVELREVAAEITATPTIAIGPVPAGIADATAAGSGVAADGDATAGGAVAGDAAASAERPAN